MSASETTAVSAPMQGNFVAAFPALNVPCELHQPGDARKYGTLQRLEECFLV